MADVFDGVLGQPRVRSFLRSSVSSGRVSHAYLFVGPAGSGKTQAAYALAQAIVCPQGGCGSCDDCRRVERHNHPDVHYYAPEGAQGYVVSQIREIVADAALAPIRSRSKVYVLDRVDLLGIQPANAFLKTLEEPIPGVTFLLLARTREGVLPTIVSRCQVVPFRHIPSVEAAAILAQRTGVAPGVTFLLLARTREGVLPTIVSRCQVVPFRHIPSVEAAAILAQRTGVAPERARIAIEACDGSLSRALSFVKSAERAEFRARVLEILSRLALADERDVLDFAAELIERSKAPLDNVRTRQSAELEESADFLTSSALKQIELRHKRALAKATRDSLTTMTLDNVRTRQSAELEESADFLTSSALKQIELRHKRALAKATRDSLTTMTSIIRSWLRDVLMIVNGSSSLVVNTDALPALNDAAAHASVEGVVFALREAYRTDEALRYNVSPETCIDALLFSIREVLHGSGCPR